MDRFLFPALQEARRSRSLSVADEVAIMKGGQKEGCRIPGRYHPRKLLRVSIGEKFKMDRGPDRGGSSSRRLNTHRLASTQLRPLRRERGLRRRSHFCWEAVEPSQTPRLPTTPGAGSASSVRFVERASGFRHCQPPRLVNARVAFYSGARKGRSSMVGSGNRST
jgi:hypothetical protein